MFAVSIILSLYSHLVCTARGKLSTVLDCVGRPGTDWRTRGMVGQSSMPSQLGVKGSCMPSGFTFFRRVLSLKDMQAIDFDYHRRNVFFSSLLSLFPFACPPAMSHSEASGPHNPYRPSKRRQPEPLKEDKEGWEKMCGYVDKIASSWGYDNKYNDGLWTPSEWAEGWKYIVSLEAWNKLTNPVHRENALRYLDPSKTFPADIFNPNFVSHTLSI